MKQDKIEHFYQQTDGFFNFGNFYSEIAEWIPDGGIWVEVGVYWGRSFSFGMVEALNRGKKIDFVAVDAFPWTDTYRNFTTHMRPLEGKYRVLVGDSAQTADKFEDKSVDFVFLDADHSYNSIRRDIEAWLPKVRPGGILAGHDYNLPWDGVIRAVNEKFGYYVVPVVSDDNPEFFCWRVQL